MNGRQRLVGHVGQDVVPLCWNLTLLEDEFLLFSHDFKVLGIKISDAKVLNIIKNEEIRNNNFDFFAVSGDESVYNCLPSCGEALEELLGLHTELLLETSGEVFRILETDTVGEVADAEVGIGFG